MDTKKIYLLFLYILFTYSAHAQDPGLEYFAKVPTKYTNPSVSPLKFFHISYIKIPSNKYLKNNISVGSDLFKFKIVPRVSVVFSLGFNYGVKQQKKNLYTVNNQTAVSSINFGSYMPLGSISCSYGFYYPYFIRGGIGVYSIYERANYKVSIPQQVSGSNDIETRPMDYTHQIKLNSGIQPYTFIELYSPFKDAPNDNRRMGATGGVYFWPANEKGFRTSLTIGIYWNAN